MAFTHIMMMNVIFCFITLCHLVINPAHSLPLCTDSRAPLPPKTPLAFCKYNGSSCCDSIEDLNIKKQFESMSVSQPACASILKSILCSKCGPFSAELFTIKSVTRQVPVLCNSTDSSNSGKSYCETVWDTCQNVSITNSPLLQAQTSTPSNKTTKLTDIYQSRSDFCNVIGGPPSQDSVCFNGQKANLNVTTNSTKSSPGSICLEKIANGSYLDMVPHTDGSNRAFFSNQKGQIWLATIPEIGSGRELQLDESNPFLDLTDEVHFDTQFGLMSIALHPNFAQNGRFFASFNCDKSTSSSCAGRCACNSDVNCDPSKLSPDSAAQPCQYQTVVAEYTVNGTSSSRASVIPTASPVEVRRIFTMGLPFTTHHGGQILFGPNDGYLYLMMGDGGAGDPYNFAQNKNSLLGKIMRFDVDNTPSEADITRLGLWGNYTIPSDNPYTEDKDLLPEIWALGLSNPWRCSFDSERPSYFMCADVGQNVYEEVDTITKGGNYGWRVYEGPNVYVPDQSPGGNTSAASINPIFPVMGYKHSDVNKNEGSASIAGGFFYRSATDPCLYGSYLYGDLYAHNIWAGVETPENSGNFTTSGISFGCAKDSPVPCTLVPGSELPALGYLFSFAQDNNKDIHLLTSSGVYRIVPPSRCGYTCALESITPGSTVGPGSPPPSSATMLNNSYKSLVLFFLLSLGFSY
ncbi:HIPL1 protein-like [Rutidosis leptorrhynchoides]|uniref:HIPL1 protein-like n=1 Tax=Rutidosis leptorrhynchoides TaxID=125765 RepID=UPI003A99E75B